MVFRVVHKTSTSWEITGILDKNKSVDEALAKLLLSKMSLFNQHTGKIKQIFLKQILKKKKKHYEMSFVSYSYMYMCLNGVPLCFFPGCSGAYCTPSRYSVNMVCRSCLQPSSDNPRALHSLCSSATVRSLMV